MDYTLIVFIYFISKPQHILSSTSNYLNVLKHLGTKTPYRVIANRDDTPLIFDGCEPIKIWMVTRHGTRNPSKEFIRDMNTRLPILRENILKNNVHGLQNADLENLRNWKMSVEEIDEKILAPEGEDEMIQLAERMRMRLPNILPHIYSNTSYKFRYTATQRAEESARNFAVGLFGRQTSNSVWYPAPLKKDPILRFYKLCDKWRRDIKKNPGALVERNLFIHGQQMQKALKDITSKLGLDTLISFEDALTMYLTCAFETSWNKTKLSPWCAAFSNETIKVLEYSEDLKYYWVDGYGYNLTYQQACPAMQNMVQFFQRMDEYPKAVLYFTHSGTILKLLAHFGLYKDEKPLRHDNYIEQAQRQWRVSKIDAFGSNLAVVLFRCGKSKKILLMHQERIVKIPGCSNDLCDFNDFLNIYKRSIQNCNFAEMCTK